MGPFRKRLSQLQDEEAQLQSRIAAQSLALAAQGADADSTLRSLQPLTRQLVRLRQRIRARTPWRVLSARRDALRGQIEAMGRNYADDRIKAMQRRQLEIELHDLDAWLESPRRRPVTLKSLALLIAVVAAMVLLPGWLARWLAG